MDIIWYPNGFKGIDMQYLLFLQIFRTKMRLRFTSKKAFFFILVLKMGTVQKTPCIYMITEQTNMTVLIQKNVTTATVEPALATMVPIHRERMNWNIMFF